MVSKTSTDSVSELRSGVSSRCSRNEVSSVFEMLSSLTKELLSSAVVATAFAGLIIYIEGTLRDRISLL